MLTRLEAFQKIKSIQSGYPPDRTVFPDEMKGLIAKQLWDDSTFTYGIEYGYMMALMDAFAISLKDIKNFKVHNLSDGPITLDIKNSNSTFIQFGPITVD